MANRLRGGELLTKTLFERGVRTVFGIPGTQTVGLFEAFRRSPLHLVTATSELGSAFMANGYARASARLAVVCVSPGPGFLCALTGIGEARHDSAPLLLLTSAPRTDSAKHFQLQHLPHEAIVRTLAKGVFVIEEARALATSLEQAVMLATTGEPGPVYVEIASGLLEEFINPSTGSGEAPSTSSGQVDFSEILELLRDSKRTVLFLGAGTNASADLVQTLAERLRAPVVTTCSARGIIPEDHPLVLGHDFSVAGVEPVNQLFEEAELVLALGCKFSHNGTAGYRLIINKEKLIHLDAEREVLGVNYPARITLQADVRSFLSHALLELSPSTSRWDEEVLPRVRNAALDERTRFTQCFPSSPQGADWVEVFNSLRSALPRESIVVTDSGLHQVITRAHYPIFRPRGLIVPTDFQSMGFGIPAAIGAAIAEAGTPVVAIIGDGGFLMSGMELTAAVREQLNLTVVIFVDGQYGQIRNQQISNFGHDHGVRLPEFNYRNFADAIGMKHFVLEPPVQQTFEQCFHEQGVKLLEVPLRDASRLLRTRVAASVRETIKRSFGREVTNALREIRRFGRK